MEERIRDRLKDKNIGLTKEEVTRRVKEGMSNKCVKSPSRTFGQIVRANVLTLFNAINLVLALIVIWADSAKNSAFAFVIVFNTIIGIIQEVRAKKTIEKLSILSKSKVTVIRDGKSEQIDTENIVIDDLLFLKAGEQIPVDCVVVNDEGIQVNESLLTGESDIITRDNGDELLSGSFVGNSCGYAKVIRVGKDTYSAKLSEEARKYKKIKSVLQESMNKILKVVLRTIIPTAALLLVSQLIFLDIPFKKIIIGVVAGISGMIPQGLILLTSLTFVVSIVKLSKYNTLVQELPATEVLARVNMLCLDKTGTITKGSMKLKDVKYFNDDNEYVDRNINTIVKAFAGTNETQNALRQRFNKDTDDLVTSKIPFSSDKKWSSIVINNSERWFLGAPDILYKSKYIEIQKDINDEISMGRRVLMVAKSDDIESKDIPHDIIVEALIVLEEDIREEAYETIAFFEKQGVDIKIISGDNPISVSVVAKNVGVKNSEKYIDLSGFDGNQYKYEQIVKDYTVFGRVNPHQKKKLVKALKKLGNTVAMTGDGINDVLALKESDCAIAMASGSDASKAVSQLVLIDSNFASLPHVVNEGRKAINNLELAANLYLTKTTYSILISILVCIFVLPFPYEPIQLTIIGSLAIGIPSFFIAVQSNNKVVKPGFLRRILVRSVPNGIGISLGVIGISLFYKIKGYDLSSMRTTSILFMGLMSMMILASVCRPFTKLKVIVVTVSTTLFIAAFCTDISRRIFSFSKLSLYNIIVCGIATVGAIFIINIIRNYIIKYAERKNIQ